MKRFKYQGLAALLAGLVLSGCASTAHLDLTQSPGGGAKRFVALDASAPPTGAMQFCAADPARCGPNAVAFFSGADLPTASSIAVGGIGDSQASANAGADAFRYLLAARRQSAALAAQVESDDAIVVSASKSVRVTLTDELWSQLKRVQSDVNQKLLPATDQQIYGREEVWALPLESWSQKGAPRGDCEDYALEKRLRLLELGWAPEALSIVVVDAPRYGAHAVLVVSTDRGEFVLDNMRQDPVLAEELPYIWVSRQSGLDLLAWTQTRLVDEPAAPATSAPSTPMPETLFASLLQERIKRANAEQDSSSEALTVAIKIIPANDENAPTTVLALADADLSKSPELAALDVSEDRVDMALTELLDSGFAPYIPFAPELLLAEGPSSDVFPSDGIEGDGIKGDALGHEQNRAAALLRKSGASSFVA